MMQLSNSGLQKIVQREGVFLKAYKDSVGVWTIGTGHTSAAGLPKVTPTLTITKQQNADILRADLAPIEQQVNDTVKVKITQNQYDALISIIFNVGPKFLKSTCMKKLNAWDYQGAADAIMLWNIPPEILGRRASEKKQFLTPDSTPIAHSTAGTIIVAGTVASTTVASQHPHIWPYILIGTIVIAGLTWLGVRWLETKGKSTNV